MSFSFDTLPTPDGSHSRLALCTLVGLSLASTLACDSEQRGAKQAFYDQPHAVPAGIPFEDESVENSTPSPAAEGGEECKRGRGLDKDGACTLLATREHEFGGMVQIPTGAFIRGDIPQRYDGKDSRERAHARLPGQPLFPDELPSFWMDGYEISREAYAKCVAEGSCGQAVCVDGSDGRPPQVDLAPEQLAAFPQTCVSHEQAESYCEWRGHRLPTEAEWEYAARGPQAWMFPWGNDIRDELGLALGPVGFDPLDVSYFGLKGFGGNAIEWVADTFSPDDNLARYLQGEFRSPDGPLAKAWGTWMEGLCGAPDCELGQRYAVKGGRSGARAGAWQIAAGKSIEVMPEENFEGSLAVAQHPRLGFRCAADLEPTQPLLSVPEDSFPIPLTRQEGGYELMRAVAEAVSREEAERFCQVLAGPNDPEELPEGGHGWRLPRLEEIRALYMFYPGPGPFWSADGPVERTFVDTKTAEWAPIEAGPDAPLMAACIRNL